MEFGIFNLMGSRDPAKPTAEVFAEVAEQTRVADEFGYAIAWFAEHHFSNYCLCASPLKRLLSEGFKRPAGDLIQDGSKQRYAAAVVIEPFARLGHQRSLQHIPIRFGSVLPRRIAVRRITEGHTRFVPCKTGRHGQ
jgi:hypothetical protein